jgi:hypothetical protein
MTASAASLPSPYVGPRAFTAGEVMYGRDQEVADLLDLVIAERNVLLYRERCRCARAPRRRGRGRRGAP